MRTNRSIWAFFLVSFFAVAATVTILPACGSDGKNNSGGSPSASD